MSQLVENVPRRWGPDARRTRADIAGKVIGMRMGGYLGNESAFRAAIHPIKAKASRR